jgi:hypothetical protein
MPRLTIKGAAGRIQVTMLGVISGLTRTGSFHDK